MLFLSLALFLSLVINILLAIFYYEEYEKNHKRNKQPPIETCEHKWDKWQEPEINHSYGFHVQSRVCKNCGLYQCKSLDPLL